MVDRSAGDADEARVCHGFAAVVGRSGRELGLIDTIEEHIGEMQRESTHSVGKKPIQVPLDFVCGSRTTIEFQEAGTPLSKDPELVSACGVTGNWAERVLGC